MAATIQVRLDKRVLEQLIRQSPQKAGRALRALALEGERITKMSFGASPSAPYEPPGIDTGTLKNSIHVENRGPFAQAVVTGVDYSVFLEYGTSRMAARPFMMPMARQLEEEAPRVFDRFLEG